MKSLLIKLPDDLHRSLKVKCAQEGKTIHGAIVDLIARYVKENGKLKTK